MFEKSSHFIHNGFRITQINISKYTQGHLFIIHQWQKCNWIIMVEFICISYSIIVFNVCVRTWSSFWQQRRGRRTWLETCNNISTSQSIGSGVILTLILQDIYNKSMKSVHDFTFNGSKTQTNKYPGSIWPHVSTLRNEQNKLNKTSWHVTNSELSW